MNSSKSDILEKIRMIEKELKITVKNSYNKVHVFSFGTVDSEPKYLSIWVVTKTDKEKNIIINTLDINKKFTDILIKIECPEDAKKHITFTVESQETVDREYEGNWWNVVK